MSFLAELKQRKVFRVGALYLVVAWVAIQAASIALPAFAAPDWAMRVVILVFALGFPLALLLTWALDVTRDGITVTAGGVGNKRIAAIAALLVVLAFAWYFWGQPAVRQQQLTAERSIAVLPFVNMSGDKANEYFSDGLAETTLDMLAQVKDLKVIARTSSFAFKGQQADMREIGRALGAAHLLEGSVQRAGKTVRITAQLIRVSDGSHLWSKRFDRELADVFAIQDEIATEVVRAIQGALPAAEQARLVRKRTDNVAAYNEYLKGIALLPERNNKGLRQALAHFERAIELDPEYARAYAMAGTATGLLRTYGGATPEQERRQAHFIDRALELAPALGEAHVARGAQLEAVRDLPGAEQAYQRGIELAPGYATGHQWLGEFYLDQLGLVDKALPLLERAMALDPLSPIAQKEYAQALASVGRLEEAEKVILALLAHKPDFAPARQMLAEIRTQRGDLVGALRAVDEATRLDPDAPFYLGTRCALLLHFGAIDAGRACVQRYRRVHADGSAAVFDAMLLVATGQLQQALSLSQSSLDTDPFLKANLLLALDRPDEAEALLRTLPPKVIAPGLFRVPPATKSPYSDDLFVVGLIRLRQGDTASGTALLEAAARQAGAQPVGSGPFTRGWTDVMALGALGRFEEACTAFRTSVDAGFFGELEFARGLVALEPLYAQPCFRDTLAKARARAAAEVAKAAQAGLLELG
ncbi:MAG TPA: tetratricopeptide repeat protein [Thermomonas sp.]|nr:tetratricopeptide repeat protein [Thermomonas sp.]